MITNKLIFFIYEYHLHHLSCDLFIASVARLETIQI